MKKGFTLIELLVVVLIIGILSAVALPQYTKAVEKARLSEALINAKAIQDAFQMYLLENGGYPSSRVYLNDMGTATELSGGEWSADLKNYDTKYFEYYQPQCLSTGCYLEIYRLPYEYGLVIDNDEKNCYTENTDLGRYICKSLENQGWEYNDQEF